MEFCFQCVCRSPFRVHSYNKCGKKGKRLREALKRTEISHLGHFLVLYLRFLKNINVSFWQMYSKPDSSKVLTSSSFSAIPTVNYSCYCQQWNVRKNQTWTRWKRVLSCYVGYSILKYLKPERHLIPLLSDTFDS